jgi:hypothetical protein
MLYSSFAAVWLFFHNKRIREIESGTSEGEEVVIRREERHTYPHTLVRGSKIRAEHTHTLACTKKGRVILTFLAPPGVILCFCERQSLFFLARKIWYTLVESRA